MRRTYAQKRVRPAVALRLDPGEPNPGATANSGYVFALRHMGAPVKNGARNHPATKKRYLFFGTRPNLLSPATRTTHFQAISRNHPGRVTMACCLFRVGILIALA